MYLYLVRHGEALSKGEDPERSLSDKGLRDIGNVAHAASSRKVTAPYVFHSGKKRALQTAEIIAGSIVPEGGVMEKKGLNPEDDPGVWAALLEDMHDDVMLVGHLPHLEKLALMLLRSGSLSFGAGQMACLERDKSGAWSLKWTIIPADEG